MQMSRDFKEFVELLNSNRVEYLIVGGYAVAWHGHPRYTGDIDILIRPSESNARLVIEVLRQFGFSSLQLQVRDFLEPRAVIQLGYPPNRIDLLTSISGVTFDEAWSGRVAGELDDLPVGFIGRAALLRNKKATGRPKDAADADELRGREP